MKINHLILAGATFMSAAPALQASVSLDRTRIIFREPDKAVSVSVKNPSTQQPFLAQSWLGGDTDSEKKSQPLVAVPPVQRLEPDSSSIVTLKPTALAASLPKDRESVLYFNLRGIPPKSSTPNTLQLAMQTRVKVFYRPAALAKLEKEGAWQKKVILTRRGNILVARNPSPFNVVIIRARTAGGKDVMSDYPAVTLPPMSSVSLPAKATQYGTAPVFTYLDDFGGKVALPFRCNGNTCNVTTS
ncbi:fimbria/pilus periplasmic chaperone [Enterobacter bugandensis]|uniref:fimbria/pilus periplasmic chaperone n=1 Tax=Enterobacter bugandensis TaxID=881260 RepID=UPI002FD0C733